MRSIVASGAAALITVMIIALNVYLLYATFAG